MNEIRRAFICIFYNILMSWKQIKFYTQLTQ